MKLKLCLFTLLLVFCLPFALAGDVNVTAGVGDATPVASNALLNGGQPIVLTAGTNTTVNATVTISDSNGYTDITAVTGQLYRSDIRIDDPLDPETHYATTCTSNGDGNGTTESYTCSFDMVHYASPTDVGSLNELDDWEFSVVANDSIGEGIADTHYVELYTLTAFSLDSSSIDFGLLALDADTGSTNSEIIVTNAGNEGIDMDLSGTNMTCTTGTLDVSYIKYSLLAFTYSLNGTSLSNTPVEANTNLAKGSSTTPLPVTSIYFGLGFPASGIGGNCDGTISLGAVSDPFLA